LYRLNKIKHAVAKVWQIKSKPRFGGLSVLY
jgi:hypothetical protein